MTVKVAVIYYSATGTVHALAIDAVVNAGGMAPDIELHDAVRGAREVYAAGGCVGAATFLQAIHGGAGVGRSL